MPINLCDKWLQPLEKPYRYTLFIDKDAALTCSKNLTSDDKMEALLKTDFIQYLSHSLLFRSGKLKNPFNVCLRLTSTDLRG